MRLNNLSLLPLTITIFQYCDLLGLLDKYPCIVLTFKPSSMLFIIRITHNSSSLQYLIGESLAPLSNLSHLRTHTGFTIPPWGKWRKASCTNYLKCRLLCRLVITYYYNVWLLQLISGLQAALIRGKTEISYCKESFKIRVILMES